VKEISLSKYTELTLRCRTAWRLCKCPYLLQFVRAHMPLQILLQVPTHICTRVAYMQCFVAAAVWELFTSETVMDEGMTVGQMFYMIAYQSWRPDTPADCPTDFAELMTACWHEDPEQRPTASQVLSKMQKLYAGVKKQYLAALAASHSSSNAGAATASLAVAGLCCRDSDQSSTADTSAARLTPALAGDAGDPAGAATALPAVAAAAPASTQSFGQQQQQQQRQVAQQMWQHQEQQLREVLQESARNFRAKGASRARRGSSMEGRAVDSLDTTADGRIGPGVDSAAPNGPSTGRAAAALSQGLPRSPFAQAQ
jgi:negative regulator of sigma E activity